MWQLALCESLDLRGRIIVSPHGINVTVGGELSQLRRYVRATKGYAGFADADIKWSAGSAEDFPRLSVRVRPEIVTFGVPGEVAVDENGVVDGGIRLSPHELHALIDSRADVVMFDGRNEIEGRIGHFDNAVITPARSTRDFVTLLDRGDYDHLKDKPVVTYCTGGVRCEVLTALMRRRGFEEVYQLDGGIVRYGETFGDDGHWRGSMFVFDKRMSLTFSDNPEAVGECSRCGAPTDAVADIVDDRGRQLDVVCPKCQGSLEHRKGPEYRKGPECHGALEFQPAPECQQTAEYQQAAEIQQAPCDRETSGGRVR